MQKCVNDFICFDNVCEMMQCTHEESPISNHNSNKWCDSRKCAWTNVSVYLSLSQCEVNNDHISQFDRRVCLTNVVAAVIFVAIGMAHGV